MLLTLLGEYVAPRDRPVFRDALVAALGAVGYKTNTSRQTLARSVASGWLESSRVGRRSLLRLSRETHGMLRAGYPRIYRFGEPRCWDGRWLLAVLRVPEERRSVRDRVRTQLTWAGFGSLGGGVWISTHVDRQAEFQTIARDGGTARTFAFRAEQLPVVGDPRTLVEQAWDLDEIRECYERFIRTYSDHQPQGAERVFQAQTELVHAWSTLPFFDPDLPDELLPADWPRTSARELFVELHSRWQEPAESFFDALNT